MRGEELQSLLDRLLAEWESEVFPSPLVGRVPPRGGMRLGLGAPKGQPHASPGQRPGFLRPESMSPEGAIPLNGLRTPRFGTPVQGLDGSAAGHPGALPRAGVCRAVGAPGTCKACGHGFSCISCISWFHNPQGADRWPTGWGGPLGAVGWCEEAPRIPSKPRWVGATQRTKHPKEGPFRADRWRGQDSISLRAGHGMRTTWHRDDANMVNACGATGLQHEAQIPLVGRVPPRGGMRLGLGTPKGQPHASPGQRPGFLRPDSTSPEGAIPTNSLQTPGFGTPFQGLDGSAAGHPGALPRAGVCRAVGAPETYKACGHGFSCISCISWFHKPPGADRWPTGWGGPLGAAGWCAEAPRNPSRPRRVGATKHTKHPKEGPFRADRWRAQDSISLRAVHGMRASRHRDDANMVNACGATGLQHEAQIPLVGRVPPRGGMRLGLGTPKGQPHASPGQRPGFLRPDSMSPEGAIPPHDLHTSGFGTPFQGFDGSAAGHPGALPRAGVCRAVGAPGTCKASQVRVHCAGPWLDFHGQNPRWSPSETSSHPSFDPVQISRD